MNDQEIKKWAKRFAAELRLADEPGIIDQVVGRHLATLDFLKSRMRWRGIANILTQAGVRREDGESPLSEDQLRASRSRMRRRTRAACEIKSSPSDAMPGFTSNVQSKARVTLGPLPTPKQVRTTLHAKDVSDDEIATALRRINRSARRKT